MPNVSSCPELQELAKALLGKLPTVQQEALEQHLAVCPYCAIKMQQLRSAARTPPPEEEPTQSLRPLRASLQAMPAPVSPVRFRSSGSRNGIASLACEQIEMLLTPPRGPDEIGLL